MTGTKRSSRDAAGSFPDDDLPGFLSSPPGTPQPAAVEHTGPDVRSRPARIAERQPVAARRRRGRVVAVAAATVLAVCAVVTAVALTPRHPSAAGPPAATPSPPSSSAPSSSAPSSAPSSSAPPPALPDQPVQPAPGDPGAGVLAGTELTVGPGDVGAHLTAAGVALASVPAGVTAGFPTVSLTTNGGRAVLHLDMPIANCLTTTAPARPEDAGCQPVSHEFGDLATPVLRMTSDGDRLIFSGHVPTYVRPDGAPPVWTGRAYDMSVTVDLPEPTGDAPLPANGSVTIADRTAPTLPGDRLTTVFYGR